MSQVKMIYIVLVLIIAVLAVGTVFLAAGMSKYYKAYLKRGLFPNGDNVTALVDWPNDNMKALVVGDSRAVNWPAEEALDNYSVSKIALSGATSAQILNRAKMSTVNGQTDLLLICMGINDLKACYFFTEDTNKIIDNLKNNTTCAVKRYLSDETRVIICNVFPEGRHGGIRRLVWPDEMQTIIEKYNNWLTVYCEKNGYEYIDAYSLLMDGKKRTPANSSYYKDFLHLNNDGYELLNNHLKELLHE